MYNLLLLTSSRQHHFPANHFYFAEKEYFW